MTLNPSTGMLVSDLAAYLQTVANDVNSLWASNAVTWPVSFRTVILDTDEIICVDVPIEVFAVSAGISSTLEHLTIGREGMIRVLLFDDSITVVHSSDIQLKDSDNFPAQAGDVMIFVNRDGVPETSIEGYWKEIYRLIAA